MPRVLSTTAQRILSALPPYLQNSVDVQGAVAAAAAEITELDDTLTAMLGPQSNGSAGQLFPLYATSGTALTPTAWTATTYSTGASVTYKGNVYTATSNALASDVPGSSGLWQRVPHANRMRWLPAWERLLNIAVDSSKSDAQRRANIKATLLNLKQTDSAVIWEQSLDTVVGSSSWRYLLNGNTLTLYLPYGDPLTSPTGLSVGAPTSGGNLTVGKQYYYAVSAYNAYGETAITTPAQTASATTSINKTITINWTAPATGAVSGYYIYRGESATALTRLTTVTGATSYPDTGAATPSSTIPTGASPVQSAQQIEALRLARRITPAHIIVNLGYTAGFILNVSTVGSTL